MAVMPFWLLTENLLTSRLELVCQRGQEPKGDLNESRDQRPYPGVTPHEE